MKPVNFSENIYSPKDIKRITDERSLHLSKKLGQNFLLDKNISEKIVSQGLKARSKCAFEIGGGLGSISKPLSEIYETLFICEYDKGFQKFLSERYGESYVLHENVLDVSLKDVLIRLNSSESFDVYGNVPYNISSMIIEWLLIKNRGFWNYAVFLVQTDFAKRLSAKLGSSDYSALTLLADFACDVKPLFSVGRNVFFPKPKVDSSVILITPKSEYSYKCFDLYRAFVKTMFHNRRKTLRNNMLKSPYIPNLKEYADDILNVFSIDKTQRGETLSSDKVYEISLWLKERGF